MYIKIRKVGAPKGQQYTIINISKTAKIQELRKMIERDLEVKIQEQQLFYKGKQLIDDHRIFDYEIKLNDIVELIMRAPKEKQDISESKASTTSEQPKEKNEMIETESKYYKVDDQIDVCLMGAWYEAIIVKIFRKLPKSNDERETPNEKEINNDDLIFKVENEEHVIPFEENVKFKDIRPRSNYIYKTSELCKGMTVLVSYNIAEPKSRGPWYDLIIEDVSQTAVKGTLLIGQEKTPIENCSVKFVNEIMKIEKPVLSSEKQELKNKLHQRKYPLNCEKCKDIKTRKCKECGCRICGGKDSWDKIILCDECEFGYHTACLDPPLESVPEEDEWYCPNCKTDDTEIVRAGEKLKKSNKKAKMPSNMSESKRDWGKGMACVGMVKECTIVPKNHVGPIPGVDVGTCWKFRIQVAEAGIHRPPVAGIHGRETDAAYSLVLSGGYEDDIDNGNEFFYTGSGGRDLSGNKRVSEQSCDQKLTKMNKALALNCNAKFNEKEGAEAKDWKAGKPVRVVRNYKLAKHSKYAPKEGNRYDGLYKVVKYYPEKGKSGFIIWRYFLRRDDPTSAPWEKGGQELEMIYPDGYLEAQEAEQKRKEKELQSKNKENTTNAKSPRRGSKRRAPDTSTKPLTEYFNTPKKTKQQEYKLDSKIENTINSDEANEKLWSECKNMLKEGKQKFLAKVEELFMCICCLEVAFNPVTTECKHNVCQKCLKRSFASEMFTCPCCRFDLGKKYAMKVNEKLGEALKLLFPGYQAGR